jgi:hypothetical protein
MEADRWYSPASDGKTGASGGLLRIVRVTGGFRGFGGTCMRLPTVTAIDDELFVMNGDESWQLLADAFGTYWHRVQTVDGKSKKRKASQAAVDQRGTVTWDGTQQFAELAEASSYACDGQTLAVTLPTSYHVFLVARAV